MCGSLLPGSAEVSDGSLEKAELEVWLREARTEAWLPIFLMPLSTGIKL